MVVLWACGGFVTRAAADQPAAPGAQALVNAAPAGMHGIVQLDGPWRFQMGDDPKWSDPAFDDSGWPTVMLNKTLSEQGFETYAGYGWYRIRILPNQFHPGKLRRMRRFICSSQDIPSANWRSTSMGCLQAARAE